MPSNSIVTQSDALGTAVTCYAADGSIAMVFRFCSDMSVIDSALPANPGVIIQDNDTNTRFSIDATSGDIYAGAGATFHSAVTVFGNVDARTAAVLAINYRDENNNQVVGIQQSSIDDSDGLLTHDTDTINAILAAMRNHGLIAS